MKFSENWLRTLVDIPVDHDALCEQVTMLGLEVDSVESAAPVGLDGIKVGRIEQIEPHPDADGLQICQVATGDETLAQIVCGAPNARTGLCAPVALPGVTLPGGQSTEVTSIRGVESQGMLCASAELGMDDDDSGLLQLDADAQPGSLLIDHLDLTDRIIEIDLTPNRGDCLSVLGVAREAAVANQRPLLWAAPTAVEADSDAEIPVHIQNTEACPGYCGRLIEQVDASTPTPDWMRERLRRGGVRSLGILVDVTNYVMLELGQPMHAFDADRLNGGIVVRDALAGEQVELLDGETIELQAGTLVIADNNGPVALAGVMGGEATSVSHKTRRVFLESATFNPAALAGEGRRYKRHTDALHRFERGVDPALGEQAIERATALIKQIAGGQAGPVTRAEGRALLRAVDIPLSHERLLRLLGSHIPQERIPEILAGLGMTVESAGEGRWRVTPPSFRFDIALEADLIEEVARVHGYDRLLAGERRVPVRLSGVDESRVPRSRIHELLLQRGYTEAVTYGFVEPALQAELNPEAAAVSVDNPISVQLAQMRTTIWSSLLPAWQNNLRRQEARIRLFERGLVFDRDTNAEMGIRQASRVAGIVSGLTLPELWGNGSRQVDFFDVKSDVEALFRLQGGTTGLSATAAPHPALHPGRSARLSKAGRNCGWLGELHPKFKKILGVKQLPIVFEVVEEEILSSAVPRYQNISPYPSVRRDLAFLVPESLPASDLVSTIEATEEPLMRQVFVFDLYSGPDLENGFKSIALGLIFQDDSSTLVDDVVDKTVARLTGVIEREHGARLRG